MESIWDSLESKFKTEDKKVKSSKRSGNGLNDNFVSTWPFYRSLLFLRETTSPRDSSGNLSCLFEKPSKKKTTTILQDKKDAPTNPKTDEKTTSKPTMNTLHEKEIRKIIQKELLRGIGDDDHESFLKCLLPFVENIPEDDVLQYRVQFTALTDKFEKLNEEGKQLGLIYCYKQ